MWPSRSTLIGQPISCPSIENDAIARALHWLIWDGRSHCQPWPFISGCPSRPGPAQKDGETSRWPLNFWNIVGLWSHLAPGLEKLGVIGYALPWSVQLTNLKRPLHDSLLGGSSSAEPSAACRRRVTPSPSQTSSCGLEAPMQTSLCQHRTGVEPLASSGALARRMPSSCSGRSSNQRAGAARPALGGSPWRGLDQCRPSLGCKRRPCRHARADRGTGLD